MKVKCKECGAKYQARSLGAYYKLRLYVHATCCPDGIVCWRCLIPHLEMHQLAGENSGVVTNFYSAKHLVPIMNRSREYQKRKAKGPNNKEVEL